MALYTFLRVHCSTTKVILPSCFEILGEQCGEEKSKVVVGQEDVGTTVLDGRHGKTVSEAQGRRADRVPEVRPSEGST